MLKSYSVIEQMQNELQWWEEQKMSATSTNDLQYVKECQENIKSLLSDIRKLQK